MSRIFAVVKTSVSSIALWSSSLLLTALLLLSPCKVRHSVQTLLDVPLTEVSSKSQSHFQTTICTPSLVETQRTFTLQSSQFNGHQALLPQQLLHVVIASENAPSLSDTPPAYRSVTVPYYILFKNFKARPVLA